MLSTWLFYLFVIGIEFFIFYSPLYYIGYKVFSIDKRIGDYNLAVLLVIFTIGFCTIFFNKITYLLYYIFFTLI